MKAFVHTNEPDSFFHILTPVFHFPNVTEDTMAVLMLEMLKSSRGI